jgi:hypothetical protein
VDTTHRELKSSSGRPGLRRTLGGRGLATLATLAALTTFATLSAAAEIHFTEQSGTRNKQRQREKCTEQQPSNHGILTLVDERLKSNKFWLTLPRSPIQKGSTGAATAVFEKMNIEKLKMTILSVEDT